MELKNTHYFLNNLNSIFEDNIKFSFISDLNIIIVTKEDKVFEFKKDEINYLLLVFGSNKFIIEQKISESLIEELSNKGIIDFKYSCFHTIALTLDGKLYCWGSNWSGVLGIGKEDKSKKFYKPKLNKELINKQIIEMSCGRSHSLVLTIDGEVYGWGDNEFGQIGNRLSGTEECQLKPYLVNEFNSEKVRYISCGNDHSLALTQNGRIYSWGYNSCGQLGRNTGEKNHLNCPKLIDLKEKINIESICCGAAHSLLLSREGDIYGFGSNYKRELGINTESDKQLLPIKLNYTQKFTKIASHSQLYFSAALSINGLYYIWGECKEGIIREPKETKLKSFNEIFIHNFGINFRITKFNVSDIVNKTEFSDNFVRNGFFEKNFFDRQYIGEGSYGKVFKVKKLNNNKHYDSFAIKRINLIIDEYMNINEIIMEFLEKRSVAKGFRSERVVKYFDTWLEVSTTDCYKISKLTFNIQMELCDKNLQDLKQEMKNNVKLIDNNNLTLLGYYISTEIFVQILEGLDYLHTRNPQIIHKNLHPKIILLTIENSNKTAVKISGLEQTCMYKFQSHRQDKFHMRYSAPEFLNSHSYDTRADIYSLGVILQELFLIDVNRVYNDTNNETNEASVLTNKYHEISKLFDKMTQILVKNRPESCKQMLAKKIFWTLSESEFNSEHNYYKYSENCDEEYKKSFIFKLIKKLLYVKEKFTKLKDIRNGHYGQEFNEINKLGKGSFGKVFKVEKLNESNLLFAIKRIKVNELKLEDLKELENFPVIKELDNEKIVKYYDLWLENKNPDDFKNLNLLLFIQMEICDISLKYLIDKMQKDSKIMDNNTLTFMGYYISSQLFIQILEGVHYLHTRNPQIIHRDLNPSNILLNINEENNSVVKIAGLGLVCLHKYKDQKHTIDRGTAYCAAPEALNSTNYDTRADIFSLGIIIQELFKIDFNRVYTETNKKCPLMQKYQELNQLCLKMSEKRVDDRPQSCKHILNIIAKWALLDNDFNINQVFEEFCDNCDEEYMKSDIFKLINLFSVKPYKIHYDTESPNNLFELTPLTIIGAVTVTGVIVTIFFVIFKIKK